MKKSILSADMKVIILPGLYLLILASLYYYVGKTGWEKLSAQRNNIQSARRIEATLSEKYSTLSQSQAQTDPYVDPVTYALPEKNPSLLIIGQLRNQAESRGIFMENMKFGSAVGATKDVSQVTISFQSTGDFLQELDFFIGLEEISPIVTIDRLSIANYEGSSSSEANMVGYWSAFPDKLPSVTDPIKKISEDDLATLRETANLIPPTFTSLSPQGPYARSTPF